MRSDRLDRILFQFLALDDLLFFLLAAKHVLCLDLTRDEPGAEGQKTAEDDEGHERQARHEGQDEHQHRRDGKRTGITAQLIDDRLVGGAGGAAARDEKAGGERDDERRHLCDETVADRELDEDVGRFADRHAVAEIADDDAAEDVDAGDEQAGDGIAAHEFRRTVHRTEEGAFLLELLAPALGFLLVDHAGREIGVDRHLLAGDGIQGETRADFGDTRGTLGDDDEVDGDEDQEDDQTDDEVAGHHQACETGDDAAGRIVALMAMRQDHARRRDVQRQPHHRRDQQNGRERREIERLLDPQRDHQDQHREGDREGQSHVDQEWRDRQEEHRR